MFKYLVCLFMMGVSLFSAGAYGQDCKFITYDWLITVGKQKSATDHIPHFKRLFKIMKVRGFLELGCGYSTKYFMDNSQMVTSIEFMTPGTSDVAYNECLLLYKDCTNWLPLAYKGSNSFNNACAYQCATHKDYALIDPTYIKEMDQYFGQQIETAHINGNDIDVAFVNPGVFIRGDMVNLLLAAKIPVIVAHDTLNDVGANADSGIYAWFKIKTTPDYEKIFIPFEGGTTFWIHKKYSKIIKSMKKYRDQVVKAKLQNIDELTRYKEITKIADKA